MARRVLDPLKRFESKVQKTETCHLWIGGKKSIGGYGSFMLNGISERAHRAAWILYVGKIPKNKHILHSCDIKNCVNIKHLRVGTHKQNMRDTIKRGQMYLKPRGEDHFRNYIPETIIKEIKLRLKNGEKIIKLMNEYKVNRHIISDIKRKQTYKYISD